METILADFLAARPNFHTYDGFQLERVLRVWSYKPDAKGSATLHLSINAPEVRLVQIEGTYAPYAAILEAFSEDIDTQSRHVIKFKTPKALDAVLKVALDEDPRIVGFWSSAPTDLPHSQHEHPRTQVLTYYVV